MHVIRGRKSPGQDAPLMIPFAETRIRHPIKVTFDTPEPASDEITAAAFADPVATFPPHVRVLNFSMILLACAMLLVGGIFMPGSRYATNWWHSSGSFSSQSLFPALLNHWQIAVGLIGFLVVPFLKNEHRGRIALSLSVSLGALLLISLLEQRTIGVPLVLMPLFGLVMMVLLHAVLRARTLEPNVLCLKHWQLFAGLGTAALWSLPAYESFHGGVMHAVLMSVGGPILSLAFAAASISGAMAGIISTIDGGDRFSPIRNMTARILSAAAIVVMGGCGLVMAACIGHVSAVFEQTSRWFGVGLVWLDLVINGCLLMAWSGLVERFGMVAANRRDIPEHTA
jgi:hypothetical protein